MSTKSISEREAELDRLTAKGEAFWVPDSASYVGLGAQLLEAGINFAQPRWDIWVFSEDDLEQVEMLKEEI